MLLLPGSAHALTCNAHPQLACSSKFTLVSRARGPGPAGTANFQPTNDGEGNFLCSAYADVQATGPLLAVHASLDDEGNNRRKFSLFVEQKTGYGNVPFTQVDANTITAKILAEGSRSMLFRGKTEELANVNINCRYHP
jgi:hypothetical protein